MIDSFCENGYVTWDLEISSNDMVTMSSFCSTYEGGNHRNLLGGRKGISVPLGELPPCSQRIFTTKLFDFISQYFGYECAIIEAVIIQVPPGADAQLIHPDTTLGYGLSANLAIQFDSYLTTWLIPGSQKQEGRKELNCTDDQIDVEKAKLIQVQPCILNQKYAMLYDSSILHFGGRNSSKNCNSSRMFFTFGAILPLSVMNEITLKYHEPKKPMINKRVLEMINEDMVQPSLRYNFKEFSEGNVVSFDEFALFNERSSLIADIKRVLVEDVFSIHRSGGLFNLHEMVKIMNIVMSVVRGDYENTKQSEFDMRKFCDKYQQWSDLKISNIIDKISKNHLPMVGEKKSGSIVFSGTNALLNEMTAEISELYSTFNRHRIGGIKSDVVSFVQDYLYHTFTEMSENQRQKLLRESNTMPERTTIEKTVAIINKLEDYEYESPDFHISWEDNDIREYIGYCVFESAPVQHRDQRLALLVEKFEDDTIPDIKRLFYKTFSTLVKQPNLAAVHFTQIFEESVKIFNSDTLLYGDVIIPEDLLLSWKSKPILEIMKRVATEQEVATVQEVFKIIQEDVKIPEDLLLSWKSKPILEFKKRVATEQEVAAEHFKTIVQNYFDLYMSYVSVPYLQEFLFRHFTETEIRKQKMLKASDVKIIQEKFVTIRNACKNTIRTRADIPDEVFELLETGLLFECVHTYAFKKDKEEIKKQTDTLQRVFSSIKRAPEPSAEVIFIKESKKSSEKIIELTRKTLEQIDGSDNFKFIKAKLCSLINEVKREEKVQMASTELLKEKVEKNQKVNLLC